MTRIRWTQKQDIGPAPRFGHGLAYDSKRQRTVLFGGDGLNNLFFRDTWEWDGENWTKITRLGPEARAETALVYDAARGVSVLFGGIAAGVLFGDTWEWDGEHWTQVEDRGPSARMGHAMAYDPVRARCVLFGGISAAGGLADIWEWDGEEWTQAGDGGPPARRSHGLAYEAARSRMVLFGGLGADGPLNDTWSWDGTIWTQLSDLGPEPCRSFSLTAADRLVLFGGLYNSEGPQGAPVAQALGDTWAWDGKHWIQQSDFGPGPRSGHAVAYDSDRQKLVLFGGLAQSDPQADQAESLLGDTWEHPVTVTPGQPGGGGGAIEAFLLEPNPLFLPGVFPADPQPFPVVCTVRLASEEPVTRNLMLIARFPALLFKPLAIPAMIREGSVTLDVPLDLPEGTYDLEVTLDAQVVTAQLQVIRGA